MRPMARVRGTRARRGVHAILAVGLLLAAGSASRAGAAATHGPGISLAYDVYYLAFRVLSVESTTFVESDGYRTNSMMRTVGFLGTLFPWESRSSAFGSIVGSDLVPDQYRLRSRFRGKPIEVDLRYGEGGAVDERVAGDLGEGRRRPVSEAEQSGTLDPLSAAISLSHELGRTGTCSGTRRVFDGVRRYDLRYEDLGVVELEPSGDERFGGATRLCRASVQPIGGFLETGEGAGEAPQSIIAWLASPMPGTAPVPLRLDLTGTRGTLSAYLQRAETAAAP
jgi:hypothetical protein